MFTGLIERVGVIENIEEQSAARALTIAVADGEYLHDAEVGESVSVSGVCLTMVEYSPRNFVVQAVEETLRRTTLNHLQCNDHVNLERALRVNARLGGHIVQGHVDGVGNVTSVREEGESWWVTFEPPFELMKYIAPKGSICIDGISLTVANVAYARFSVAIIPHTREVTTARDWQPGRVVNLESDILARHVERLMHWQRIGTANQHEINTNDF
jgi:riboflavin synthase